MQANRFDRAAEAPILSTYVPINFGELYRIGAAQKQAVDEAAQQLNTQLQKFGEFRSPSAVDTQKWYDSTINRKDMQEVLANMVSSPDWLKDASNRASIYGILNNIDYSTLSQLKQSREGMLARQKANQELMLKGLYNPLWHDVDFTNYDTANNGIFNDISPLAYKSEVDLVRPYVDNLKASFMGTKNGWIHQGVSTDRTDYEIQKNLSSIQNTPEYQKHLEVLQRQGLSRKDAEDQLNKTLITAGREFAYDQAERDPWWMKSAELQAKYGNNQSNYSLLNLTDQLELLASDRVNAVIGDSKNVDEVIGKLSGIYNDTFSSTRDRSLANENVVKYLSEGIGQEANNILMKQDTQSGKTTDKGWRIGNSSSDFLLRINFVNNVAFRGYDNIRPNVSALVTDFEQGKFKHFFVVGNPSIAADGNNIYHNKYVLIPEKDIKDKYKELDIEQIDGSWVDLDQDQVRITESENEYGEKKTSVNTNLKEGRYLQIPVMSVVPRSGQPAIENDALHAKSRDIGQELRDQLQAKSERRRLNIER